MSRHALAALVVAALAGCGGCHSWDRVSNQVYESGNTSAVFDAYVPKAPSPALRPAVMFIHGGAWRTGDRRMGGVEDLADFLCDRGYVMFSIDYRLAPGSRWPAQLEDCLAAWGYIRANAARYGADGGRTGVMGISAGAHLAAAVELRSDPAERPRACVAQSGEHALAMPPAQVMDDYDSIMTDVLGHGPPFGAAELDAISNTPAARAAASVLIIHARGDTNVYYPQAEALAAALAAAGADVRLVPVEGYAHGDAWTFARGELEAYLASRLR